MASNGYSKDSGLDQDLTGEGNDLAPAVAQIPFKAVEESIHRNTNERFIFFFAKLLNWFKAVILGREVADSTLKRDLKAGGFKEVKSDGTSRWVKKQRTDAGDSDEGDESEHPHPT